MEIKISTILNFAAIYIDNTLNRAICVKPPLKNSINYRTIRIILSVISVLAVNSVGLANPAFPDYIMSSTTRSDSAGIQAIELLINTADSLSEIKSMELCPVAKSIYSGSININYQRGILYGAIYSSLCKFYKDSSDLAIKQLKRLTNPVEELEDSLLSFDLFYNIGRIYESIHYADSALNSFISADAYSQTSIDPLKKSNLLTKIGLIYWDKGIFDSAITNFNVALTLREAMRDSTAMASSYNNLGAVYWKQGNYKDALNYFLKSFDIRRKQDALEEMSVSLSNMGMVYQKLKYFDKAKLNFRLAKKMADSSDYKFGKAYSVYNHGLLYADMDSLQLSSKYLRQAARLCYLYSFRNLLVLTFNYVARNYEKEGNLIKAHKLYKTAADSAKVIKDQYAQAVIYNNLSRTFFKLNKLDSSYYYLHASNAIASSQNMMEILKSNYYQEFEIYSKQKKHFSALESYKRYSEIKNELLNENLVNNITNMLIKMEIEQTEAENKLLIKEKLLTEAELENQRNLQNNIITVTVLAIISIVALLMLYRVKTNSSLKIQAQNQQLEQLNQELNIRNDELKNMVQTRDKLFSIIAHDLRNPLNTILNFASLLKESADRKDTSEIKDYVQTINKSGETLAGLIDNLLNWARNQLNQIKIKKDIFPVETLIVNVLESVTSKTDLKNIEIIKDFNAMHVVEGDRGMIELVIRNLVTNAVKFSYRNSRIVITVTKSGKNCRVSIEDFGIGISSEITDSIFMDSITSNEGTENEVGSGLGLSICKEFIEKNNGEINFTSIPGKSTIFWFTLPLKSVTHQTTIQTEFT